MLSSASRPRGRALDAIAIRERRSQLFACRGHTRKLAVGCLCRERYSGQRIHPAEVGKAGKVRVRRAELCPVLDRQGREIGRLVGIAEWDGPDALKLIDAAIAEK